MLESIRKLRESITSEQQAEIRGQMGDVIADLFTNVLDSVTEEEAQQRAKELIDLAKKHPAKLIKLRRKLTKEQRELVMVFLEK